MSTSNLIQIPIKLQKSDPHKHFFTTSSPREKMSAERHNSQQTLEKKNHQNFNKFKQQELKVLKIKVMRVDCQKKI